jgi:putative tryptophan/tyrosine transport system substrate-binding protein
MIAVLTLLMTLAARSIDLIAKESTDKIPHIGILFIGDRNQPHLEAFKQGLRERGYTEGKNIALHYRYAEGRLDRLPALASELVQLKVDVIVTTADSGARAARID